jgi:uncharacterized membrane protein
MTKKNKIQIAAAAQNNQNQQQVSVFRAASFSGPLPPPEMLRQYNEIAPGMAERIVAMAEEQSSHRRTLEKKVVFGNELRAHIGQWMAFAISLAGIGAGVYLIMHDKPTEGLVSIFGPLAAVVGIFIYGKMSQKKELAAKDRMIRR